MVEEYKSCHSKLHKTYSREHISSDEVFFKILKKPSIAAPIHSAEINVFIEMKQKTF
jgi:hypothetical protein